MSIRKYNYFFNQWQIFCVNMPQGESISGASQSPKTGSRDTTSSATRGSVSGSSTLKTGEIVRGTMIDTPRFGKATRVLLPRGTVLAESVPDMLKAGDVLQFKVKRAGTSLSLQVDAVPVMQSGRPLASSEILRMLSMHESPAMLEFVDVLKTKHSSLTRTQVTEMVEAAAALPSKAVEGLSRGQIAEVLHTMRQAGLPPKAEFFTPMRRFVLQQESLAENLNALSRNEKTASVMSQALNSARSILDAFFPASDSSHRGAVYKALKQAVDVGGAQASELAARTAEYLEGQFLHNVLVAGGGVWGIAVPIGGSFVDAKLHVVKTSAGASAFRVQTETSVLGEVTAGGSLVGKRISLSFSVHSEGAAQAILAEENDLKQQLEEHGYSVVALHINSVQKPSDNSSSTPQSGINIVV